jgi:hypothetical protein
VLYTECTTLANTEFLEKEAEYYGIDDMAIKCSSLYEFKPRCEVNWRPEVVESYFPLFAKCIIDPQLIIPFTFERNSHIIGRISQFKYELVSARCVACEETHEPKASNVFVFSLHEWSALKSHMLGMLGIVERVMLLNSGI